MGASVAPPPSGGRTVRVSSGEQSLSLLDPEKVQDLGLPQLPLMDPPQAQDVQQDGEHHHQDAEREQVVIVDEGGAEPAGVVLPQRFLLQVPVEQKRFLRLSRCLDLPESNDGLGLVT